MEDLNLLKQHLTTSTFYGGNHWQRIQTLTYAAQNLASKYSSDLDKTLLSREAVFLKTAISPFLQEKQTVDSTSEVLSILTSNELNEQFISCHTALRISLTMPVTVAKNERSKLKLIKNYLRSTMGQERLSNLAILSIEHEETSGISFGSIIEEFVAAKCRKVRISMSD